MANPRIDVEIGAKISQFQKAIADSESSLNRFGRSATKIGKGLSLAITAPILAIGAAAVKTASDFEETSSKFETVFRDISKSADEAFKDLRNNFGLSGRASKELLGNTGDLLTGFGFTQKAALDLSREVNKLAVDLASFTNFSGGAKGASDALTKALLGERESVKSLGILILEEDVKKQVAINTAKGLTFETERQAKAYAKLDLAIKQSGNAIGDYDRTKGSLANQTRLLQARIEDLSNSFGELLLPAATKIVVGINKIVDGFLSLDESTRKSIILISGLAAAIGPLSLAIGGIIQALPLIASGFAVLTGPIGATILAIGALGAGLFTFINSVELSIEAQAKHNKALSTYEKAITSVSDAQKILNDFNNSSIEKSPEFIQATKDKIKAKIDEARATLLQAKAESQLAIEEAKKESFLDILIGFERVQRRVNKVQGDSAEKISSINKLLNELTISYIKLGTEQQDALGGSVEKLGLIEDLTKRISEANEKRVKATDITELILQTKKIKQLEKELSLLNAIAKRKSSDSPEPIEATIPKEDRKPGLDIVLPTDIPGVSDRLDIPEELVESIKEKTTAIADAFSSLGVQIASSLNISNDALRGFVTTLLSNAPKIIQAIFKQAAAKKAAAEIENSANLKVATGNAIVTVTEGAKALGPVGLAVLPVLIGGALALISSAFGKGGGGSSGGGVGAGVSGTSFQGQGATAFNGNREIFGEMIVRGNDLVYVFDQSRDKIAKG